MDWIIIALIIASAIHTEWRYHSLKTAAEHDRRTMIHAFRTRMNTVKMGYRSTKDPDIDFDPKTTRRDSDDIPATGRMSRVTMHSDGGDLHEPSSGHNHRLQSSTGSSATQVGQDDGSATDGSPTEDR